MESVLQRVRSWARTRWRSAAVVVLLAGVAAGAVLALTVGARRTASAPDRYTAAFGGDPELTLLQPFGPSAAPAIAELPSVARSVRSRSSLRFRSLPRVPRSGPTRSPATTRRSVVGSSRVVSSIPPRLTS